LEKTCTTIYYKKRARKHDSSTLNSENKATLRMVVRRKWNVCCTYRGKGAV